MSRVGQLREAASSSSVKFLEVTRAQARRPGATICIFEGDDEKYFSCRLSSILGGENWVGVNTGGRKLVLDLRQIIMRHPVYKKCIFLCFIDKDYSDWLVNPDPKRIYITPCYSIENFYASQACLNGVLSAEFRVTDFNELAMEHAACVEVFKSRMTEACEYLFAFNVWAKARALMERDEKPVPKVFLQDATIDKLIKVSIQSCEIIYDPADISSVLKKSRNEDFCPESIKEAAASFGKSDRMRRFRGKQQIEVFREFMASLRDDFVSGGGIIFKQKNKTRLEFGSSRDLLSDLSQYAETPECLRQFLHSHVIESRS